MQPSSEITARWKWTIGILSLAAAALSVWLTIEKLNGTITTIAGCGGGSDCANVLGSRWSMVFGVIPVSLFSSFLYLGILFSLWTSGNRWRWLRLLAAWMIICAAVWFTVLQIAVIGSICKYCMTMHGVGGLLALSILLAEYRRREKFVRQLAGLLPVAVLLVAGLAMLQHFGPQPPTHQVDNVVFSATADDVHARGDGRVVVFFNGEKSYRVSALPHVGPSDAKHVVVKYFDYTCAACRDMHEELDEIVEKYEGKLAVVLLPTPLNRNCNPNLPTGVNDHEKACEFAYLSLGVWRASPEKFATFHGWLFENPEVPVEAAEAMAASLLAGVQIPSSNDPWVMEVLQQNTKDYKSFSSQTPVLPKLAIKGVVMMHGTTRSHEALESELKEHLDFH